MQPATARSLLLMLMSSWLLLLLLLLLSATRGLRAGGIDFDLNEPPPEKYLRDEEQGDAQLQLEAERALSALVCPAPGLSRKKLQQDRDLAATLRERFEQVSRLRQQANSAKEVPDYCDYEKFRAAHQVADEERERQDKDPGERIFRRSLYLKRCLDVFRSRVEYRLGRRTYLEGVTSLAALSPNEVGQLFMSAPPMEFRQRISEDQYKAQLREHRLALKENDLEPAGELGPAEDVAEAGAGAGANGELAARVAEKLEHGDSFAQDRSLVMDSKSVRSVIASMLDRSPADLQELDREEEYKLAVREELIGTEIVQQSEACLSFDEQGQLLEPYPANRWPLSDKRPAGRASGQLGPELAGASYEPPQLSQWRRQYLDWSHHKCFHRIYKQFENCGCCYVVAAVNLAEFVSCTERPNEIDQRKFSEMHVLNCGLKYSPYNMGCSGGSVLETLRFIGLAGVYTRKAWRQRITESANRKEFSDSRDINCPMEPGLPWPEWGKHKVLLNPVVLHPNEWLEALEDGPLVATVQMPREGIVTYSGGVHDGASCEASGIWHVMLLVGYGIDERGSGYWRFRNSFGPEWGDQGHFNLAMSVPGGCFAGGVRVYREPVVL